jgi:hypothetical protein
LETFGTLFGSAKKEIDKHLCNLLACGILESKKKMGTKGEYPMQDHPHDTAQRKNVQPKIMETSWDEEIVPALPKGTTEKARELKAFVRKRLIATPLLLFRALLTYVLCGYSYNQLGAWGVLNDIAELSDTAWQKR